MSISDAETRARAGIARRLNGARPVKRWKGGPDGSERRLAGRAISGAKAVAAVFAGEAARRANFKADEALRMPDEQLA
jgi:hypothetical protein